MILPVIALDVFDSVISPAEFAFKVSVPEAVRAPDCVTALDPVFALLIVNAATFVVGKASVAVPVKIVKFLLLEAIEPRLIVPLPVVAGILMVFPFDALPCESKIVVVAPVVKAPVTV